MKLKNFSVILKRCLLQSFCVPQKKAKKKNYIYAVNRHFHPKQQVTKAKQLTLTT